MFIMKRFLRYDEKKASNLVDCLMDIYTSHLLPTFNIVHSQYIIFYLANIDPGKVQGGIKCGNRGTGFLDSEGSHR